jgi:hypothetical protein
MAQHINTGSAVLDVMHPGGTKEPCRNSNVFAADAVLFRPCWDRRLVLIGNPALNLWATLINCDVASRKIMVQRMAKRRSRFLKNERKAGR